MTTERYALRQCIAALRDALATLKEAGPATGREHSASVAMSVCELRGIIAALVDTSGARCTNCRGRGSECSACQGIGVGVGRG